VPILGRRLREGEQTEANDQCHKKP
jgi:hypothetical protein